MRGRMVPGLVLALAVSAPAAASENEVVWQVSRAKKTKLVFAAGTKKYNWGWKRHDSATIASFSAPEKAWLQAAFPGTTFRVLREPGSEVPDEFAVLKDGRVLSKDDFLAAEAGGDGAQAVALVLRAADGLAPADGGPLVDPDTPAVQEQAPPPPPEPTPEASDDLDRFLYMDDPPAELPEPEPEPEPEPAPPPPPRRQVDRSTVAGEFVLFFVKDSATGKPAILHRVDGGAILPAMDLLRLRSFPLGEGRGFGVAFTWHGDQEGTFKVGYRMYARGPWGIEESWRGQLLDYTPAGLTRAALRLRLKDVDGGDGDPELLVEEVNLPDASAPPDPEDFLPRLGRDAVPSSEEGVVRILQLRKGLFKMVGWADLAKGDRPVAVRRNWPNYVARKSPGPSMLLSFGQPGDPKTAYPCPWPDHPLREVPWVDGKRLFKGGEYRRSDADLSMAVWTLHDTQALYLVALVRDDKVVLPGLEDDPSSGDHLQLWLDPQYTSRSMMIELLPGAPVGAGAQARIKTPAASAGPAPRVRVAARPTADGYWLEAAIPYSFLASMDRAPEGNLWGFVVNAVDVDAKGSDQKAVLSTSGNFAWAKPGSFNNLILE